MSPSLCVDNRKDRVGNRACYSNFPGGLDPYRWPCIDGSRCILKTSKCDAHRDCDDKSDEKGCPWYVSLTLVDMLLLCLAAMLLSLLLFMLLTAWSHSLSQGQSNMNQASQSSNPVALTLDPTQRV